MYSSLGCTEKITYYEKEDHAKMCPHAPCYCPEASCSFYGSTVELFEHFSAKHRWHCAKISYNKAFRFRIAQGSTVFKGEDGHMFLVNMVQVEAIGGVISVFSIQPHTTESNFMCKLAVSCPEMSYTQYTQFQTRSSNLFGGLPKDCLTFVVPKKLLRGTSTNVTAMVSVTLIPP
jgi:E3 ubiquitin-protein ligase SIAH1